MSFGMLASRMLTCSLSAPIEAGDETKPDRIAAGREYDRNFCGGFLGGESGGCAGCDDDRDLPARQIDRQRRDAFGQMFRPAVREHHVLALAVAGFLEAGVKARKHLTPLSKRCAIEPANHRQRQAIVPKSRSAAASPIRSAGGQRIGARWGEGVCYKPTRPLATFTGRFQGRTAPSAQGSMVGRLTTAGNDLSDYTLTDIHFESIQRA